MELNREEILKWWELCANDITCRKCPYEKVGNCQGELMQATLDIFKELTEKYENLEMQFREIDHECDRLEIRNEELTADVVEVKKGEVLMPITKEELAHLMNDTIAYIWRLEDKKCDTEEFGYFSRKELLEKLKQFEKEHFPEFDTKSEDTK